MKIYDSNQKPIYEIFNRDGILIFQYINGIVNLDDEELIGAEMSGYILEGLCCASTNFSYANLIHSDLYWTNAFGANFSHAKMKKADLRGADLSFANFSCADLRGANFSKDKVGGSTIVKSANFLGANLRYANFQGAIYDSATIFPSEFKPDEMGLVLAKS